MLRECETAAELAAHLDVRGDYLMVLAIVAGRSESIACAVHIGELHEAAGLLDYSADMVGDQWVIS